MSFSEDQYRARRAKRLRGQTDDRSQPKLIRPAETTTIMTPRGWVSKNRAERRQKIVDRTHTKSIKGNRKGPRNG